MSEDNKISHYLSDVLADWKASQGEFPKNAHSSKSWPIPFFGNPANATVATIGVNPSSEEFAPDRSWPSPNRPADWKYRLRDYFHNAVTPHPWFEPWSIGLELLGANYEQGTASHFDVSYRSTLAMVKNPRIDRGEFRLMVERDVTWFFKLLLLCPKLKVLLTFGPIIGKDGRPESLFGFLFESAPKHGFRVLTDDSGSKLWHEPTGKVFLVHDADTHGVKCTTCRVVKNLYANRHKLRSHLEQ